MKQCTICKEFKGPDEFYLNRTHKDGLSSKCKLCQQKSNIEYRKNNSTKLNESNKQYRATHKEQLKVQKNKHYLENREVEVARQKKYRSSQLSSWEGFIPQQHTCEVCNKIVYFNTQNKENAVHFDHRHGNEVIKGSPQNWLERHKRTPENELLWNSCDFGKLCHYCNRYLPTNNRTEFLENAVKYNGRIAK